MHDTLDELLAGAAPAISPLTPDAEAAIVAMVADARVAAARGRRAKVTRRVVGGAAVLALLTVGTAAAAGVLPGKQPRTFPGWDGQLAATTVFEWTAIHPVGQTCVEHLVGWGLSDPEVAAIKGTLSDPAALLAKDGGAVRKEFLERGWANDSAEDTAAIDAAYAEVARLDLAAGRGTLTDDQLTGSFMTNRYDELFNNIYWRLILDGIGAGPHGYHQQTRAMQSLEPDTACEYTE
jgi:hypothetical protein